jgi:predicted DNA-binding transcriptional regulator YafY
MSRTERLLNLVIALLSTRTPLSRAVIQASVAGYDTDASVAAFERMFERDKDELRSMGIPITTVTDVHGEVQGYVIDAEEYALAGVEFTADEIAVLNLAAQVWDDAVLESAAVTAVRKLESAVEDSAAPIPQTFGVLTAKDAALLPLLRAVREHRVVRFAYLKPGDDHVSQRSVEPWALRSLDGHWYLSGRDVDRNEQRVFRVSRIEGTVQVTAQEFAPDEHRVHEGFDVDVSDDITIEVAIPDGVGAELRRLAAVDRKPDGRVLITDTRSRLLSLLWRADPSVHVLGPADFVAEYREGLQRMVNSHE